jgi:hypothetical protein
MTAAAEPEGHDLCGATGRQSGKPCRRPAGWGTDHPGVGTCKLHLGSTTTHRRRAAAVMTERRVQHELGALLEELELDATGIDPLFVLDEQMRRANAMVTVLGMLVGELQMSGPSLGVDETGEVAVAAGLFGPDHNGDGRQHVLVAMYAEWVERAGRLAKLAKDAGLEERRVELTEAQGEQLSRVLVWLMDAVIARRDLPPEALRAQQGQLMRQAIEATAMETPR